MNSRMTSRASSDEVVQPLGAMLRCSSDTEGLDRFVGNQSRGAGDVAAGNGRYHSLLIDRDARFLDIGAEEFVAHDECELLPHRTDRRFGIV
jgi:hypothetical protein